MQPSQEAYKDEEFLVNRHPGAKTKHLLAGPEGHRVQKFWDEGTARAALEAGVDLDGILVFTRRWAR
eukprot:3383640-Prorocentrum_lima.AAC.1